MAPEQQTAAFPQVFWRPSGAGVTNIYSYSWSNGSWSEWSSENAPFPSQISSQGNYGQVISLSDDGNVLAISAPVGSGSGSAGNVWAFSRNGNSWEHKNNTSNNGGSLNNPGMTGTTGGDYFGSSLSVDGDGDRIAVGAQFGNDNAGHIRVFEWTYLPSVDRSQWNQIGDDIIGSDFSPGAGLGSSVALSNDGNTLVAGAIDRAYVEVYSYDGSSWTREFRGTAGNCFGGSVDIDSDGDTVIISQNGCDNQNERGIARVYRKTNGSWAQLGFGIQGELNEDEFSHEVSISDNGNIVAISSLKNPGALDTTSQDQSAGHVRVFQYTDDGWDQLENDIDGTVKDARFGDVISLQDDGKKIIVLSDEDEKVYTFTRQ